jgi:hypothetical protein
MMKFLLKLATIPSEVVDVADSPNELDFTKVAGHTHYEIWLDFDDDTDDVYLGVTVDLTGYEDQAEWVAQEICKEVDFRRAFPGFEGELKVIDGPFLAFGEG